MSRTELERVASCWEANAETWTQQTRAGYDVYRDHHNTPAFLNMLPSVSGLDGLDLGCGEGHNTRLLAARGAKLHGIDIAPTFIEHAKQAGGDVAYQVASTTELPFQDSQFDFLTAFMSLMDMPDHGQVLTEAHRVLRAGGFLQFSILHPCFVPPRRRNIRDEGGRVVAVEVADYFNETPGWIEEWHFSTLPPVIRAASAPFRVPRYHRTLSSWLNLLISTGFTIEQLREPMADEATARAHPTVADTRITPLFLHVRVRKPTSAL